MQCSGKESQGTERNEVLSNRIDWNGIATKAC